MFYIVDTETNGFSNSESLEFENGVKGGRIKELVPNMVKVDLEMSFLLKLLILINFLINSI